MTGGGTPVLPEGGGGRYDVRAMPKKATGTAPGACHFVTGSDEAGVKRAASGLADSLAPGADAFSKEVIDGAVETVEAAVGRIEDTIGALLTLPFLGGEKLVWLKSASFFADSMTGRSEAVLAAIERLCAVLDEGLPDGVRFLLSAPGADKRRTAYRRLGKLCALEVVDMPDLGFRAGAEALIEWTAGRASEHGVRMTPEAVEALAARVGLDTGQMANELEKLRTAFGAAGQVDEEDIRLLVPQTRQGGIFDLSAAIQRRNLPLALETLAQLMRQGEKGVSILLAAIVPTVRSLLVMKDLMSRHKITPSPYLKQFSASLERLPPRSTSHLPRKKDGSLNAYPLSLAATHGSNFTLAELTGAFRACASAAQQLFTGSLGDDVILARLLVGMLSRG